MAATQAAVLGAVSQRGFLAAAVTFGLVNLLALAVFLRGLPGWLGGAAALPPIQAAAVIGSGAGAALLLAAVAILIAWRRRRSAFALFVSVTLLLRSVSFVAGLPELGRDPDWSLPVALVRVLYAVLVVLLLYIFPDGRFVPRWLAWPWAAWTIWLAGTLWSPSANPILADDAPWAPPLLVGVAASGFAVQTYRYRAVATAEQRLQTKWITYGLAFYVAEFAVAQLLPLAFPLLLERATAEGATFAVLSYTAEALAASLVAVTLALAILRHRLLEIDVVVNRTLVWVTATAVVAGLFAVLSSVTQRALIELTGQRSAVGDVVVGVVVGALFGPIKVSLQHTLDRRLRRRGRG